MPALQIGGMTIGLREGVVVLIVLVAIYMAFVLLRMGRLRRRPAETSPVVSVSEAALPDDSAVPSDAVLPENADEPLWTEASSSLAEEVLRQGLAQELEQLREEVDAMRGELAALREDMQLELGHLRASQTVSPIYGDAMQLAASGYDAVAIAERCGIARAEAELVVALAKNQEH